MEHLVEQVISIPLAAVNKDQLPLTSVTENDAPSSENGHDTDRRTDDTRIFVQPPRHEQIEDVDRYEIGGYHPIHIGDELVEGNYQIVHKLGYGGLSTVWLARDTVKQRYVAVKVMVAAATEETKSKELRIWEHLRQSSTQQPAQSRLCFLLDTFEVTGPNGTHICLVYPVTGINIGQLFGCNRRLRGHVARRLARQLVETVAYLHSEGICHGDLTASNLTLKLANFEQWTEADIRTRLGKPKVEYLKTYHDDPVPKRFPKYVVQPLDLSRLDPAYITEEICLIDFGEAFFIQDPPRMLGTPEPYRSPSDWFGETPGKGSDLWALACTIFCMRSSVDIFNDALVALGSIGSVNLMIKVLGPLPDRWDRLFFDMFGVARPRAEIDSKVIKEYRREEIEYRLKPWRREPPDLTPVRIGALIRDDYHGPTRQEDLDLAEALSSWKPWYAKIAITEEEGSALGDLFTKLFRYEPEEMAPAATLLDHPWLNNEFPENPIAEDAGPLFQSNYPPFEIWDELEG